MEAAVLALKAAGPILGGISAMQQAGAQKEQAQINSYIGRTRAIQTDTSSREGLNSELANVRAVLSANGQRMNVGTFELFDELRSARGRERRVNFGNEMQTSAGFKQKANSIKPGMELAGGLIKAGPSLFDIYDWNKRNG